MSCKVRLESQGCEPVIRGKHSAKFPVRVETGDESKVQQHFAESVDINNIVRNLDATGSVDHMLDARARFGDFSDVMDLAGNMDKAVKAQQLFEHVPLELRKKVDHSIEGLFGWIADPANFDEAVKYGIFDPKGEKTQAFETKRKAKPEYAPGSNADGSLKKTKVQGESSDKE